MKKYLTIIFICTTIAWVNDIFSQEDIYGNWEILSPMKSVTEGRSTLLKSGKVLVAGNNSYCELFDHETGQWTITDSLNSSRQGHALITLNDGRALVMGGQERFQNEIYDEEVGTWTECAPFNSGAQHGGQSVLLKDGRILYIGGQINNITTNSCEIYLPDEDRWVITDSLEYPRILHKANVLHDGKVVVTGGRSISEFGELNTSEIFDPLNHQWTEVSKMHEKHVEHDALLLTDGKLMVLGGNYNNNSTHCEVYNVVSDEWTQVENIMPGCGIDRGGAVLLNDSTILIIDSSDWGLYNTKSFTPIGFFYTKNYNLSKYPMIELLIDGSVLTMGGWLFKQSGAYRPAYEAEIFRPNIINIIHSSFITSSEFTLHQNYPNPFNPNTMIKFQLPKPGHTLLEVYNTIGQKIETLINDELSAGVHSIEFNASNLTSGLYLYKIQTSSFTEVKKMIHVK